jgi:hypothetical protein
MTTAALPDLRTEKVAIRGLSKMSAIGANEEGTGFLVYAVSAASQCFSDASRS